MPAYELASGSVRTWWQCTLSPACASRWQAHQSLDLVVGDTPLEAHFRHLALCESELQWPACHDRLRVFIPPVSG
jgi:hypothetical protein